MWTGDSPFTMEEAKGSTQKTISQRVDDYLVKQLSKEAECERDKARLKSVGLPHAGDWLNAVPVKALGLNLRPREFTASVKYRLGLKVYPFSGKCIACGQNSDKFGDHSVGCVSEGERIFRHNVIRDALHMTATQASLSPAKEQSALLPGSAEKPADIYIPGWANGRDAALDVSVVSPLQQQLLKKAAEEAGSAAKKRNQEKLNKYYTLCQSEGIQFFPVVMETLGGWHRDGIDVVAKLARQLASHTGGDSEEISRHLFQRLSILLARGNAALILNRMPIHPEAVVDGDQDVDI